MEKAIWLFLVWTGLATSGLAQVPIEPALRVKDVKPTNPLAPSYTVQGATPRQEALLHSQIQAMQPNVPPQRIIFVPHWKYLYAAKEFRLHVPTGMSSKMFTHLGSRSVFIDDDHYGGDESLGYWMAHELGHLAANSTDENDAEKAAKPYRKRLKEEQLVRLH